MDDSENRLLEKYYKGGEAWSKFSSLFVDNWEKCKFKEELVKKFDGNVDIAMVVFASLGNEALRWSSEPVPALGNNSPIDCVSSVEKMKRLKTMLMRMPR